MAKLYNLARMTTATTGTGTITLGSAVSSYVTFALAGVQNGDTVTYAIVDGSNREVGRGVYTSVGTTLTRATILESTNANAAINLSGSAEVFITAAAEDITSSVQITGGSITGITDLVVADGGTGVSSLTAYAVLAGGTTSTGAVQTVSGLGTSGQVLTSNGAGALPTWQASAGSALALEYIGSGVQSGSTALAFTSIPSGYTTLYVAYTIHMNGAPDFYVNLSSNNGTSYGVNRLLNNASENDGVGSGFASISNVGTTGTSKVITPRFSYITGIANSNQRAVGTYTTAATEATITGVINAIRFNNTSFANATTVVLYGVK